MGNDYPLTSQSIQNTDTDWASYTWEDYAANSDRDQQPLAILPVCGFCDWATDLPLDSEECLAMSLLSQALDPGLQQAEVRVLPPWRFVLRGLLTSPFSIDPESAHAALAELLSAVKDAGFRKVILFNSSPWNEEFIDVAARDNRIELGLQMFCINLSGLGLDFHPVRGRSDGVKLMACLEAFMRNQSELLAKHLEDSAQQLRSLFHEILEREPLPLDGKIPLMKGGQR